MLSHGTIVSWFMLLVVEWKYECRNMSFSLVRLKSKVLTGCSCSQDIQTFNKLFGVDTM